MWVFIDGGALFQPNCAVICLLRTSMEKVVVALGKKTFTE